jgi:photosystem II stability/assembly factor-like uncharacterized protein
VIPDLTEQIRQLVDGSAPPVSFDEIEIIRSPTDARSTFTKDSRHRTGRRARSTRWSLVAASVLVVAAVGAWGATASIDQPSMPKATLPIHLATPRWQLTADLSASQFQLATGAPNGGVSEVNCGGSTCFLSTYYGDGGNTSLTGSTYVSHDAGHSWAATNLPAGVAVATSVSCVTSTWCAAGGGLLDPSSGDPAAKKEMRDPVLLVTTDAGATWSMHTMPIPPDVQQLPAYGSLPAETTYWPGSVDAVACTSVGVCHVMAHVLNNNTQSAGIIPDTVMALRTSDAGATWTASVLPETGAASDFEEQVPNGNGAALACPSQSTCVGISLLAGFDQNQAIVDTWRTTDGGNTWTESQIPGVHQVLPGITCPTAKDCWVPTGGQVLRSVDGGARWSLLPTPSNSVLSGVPSDGWQSISCTSATSCVLGGTGMVATTDGGSTWSHVTLPEQVGTVPSVACEVGGSCIAFAQAAIPPGQTFVPNGGSLILTNGSAAPAGSGPASTPPS